MREIEPSRSTAAVAFSRHSIDVVQTKESLASQQQPAIEYRCKRCQSPLITEPETEGDDWFLRCLVCGVKNLFVVTLELIGWRR